jgi:hypothetical protein
MGAKEIPMKAVGQAIHVYIMSVCKLQNGVCEQMEKNIQKILVWHKEWEKKSSLVCMVEIY